MKINQLKKNEKLIKTKLIDEIEAGKIIGMTVSTMRSYRMRKVGPSYYKMGRSVRYSKDDLYEYLKNNIRRIETNQNS